MVLLRQESSGSQNGQEVDIYNDGFVLLVGMKFY